MKDAAVHLELLEKQEEERNEQIRKMHELES
jgi:hypothetical protein